jgi:hypothetical protein
MDSITDRAAVAVASQASLIIPEITLYRPVAAEVLRVTRAVLLWVVAVMAEVMQALTEAVV